MYEKIKSGQWKAKNTKKMKMKIKTKTKNSKSAKTQNSVESLKT